MSKAKQLRKLSLKEMGCAGGKDLIGQRVAFFQVSVNGYAVKTSQYGESYGFQGDNTGINALTGDVYQAPIAYLPNDASSLLKQKLDNKSDDTSVTMQFEVVVAETPRGQGWCYVVQPVQDAEAVARKEAIANTLIEKAQGLIAIENKSK